MRSALSNGEAYIYKTGDKNDVSLWAVNQHRLVAPFLPL